MNGSSIGLWEFGTNRIPLLFLISYSNFKDLLSSFISSIINDGDIAEPERTKCLSFDKVMNALSLRIIA